MSSNGQMTSEQFRALFPLDDRLVDAVLVDYNQAQAMLLEKSANGAHADVSLLASDGRIHAGHDDFFSSGDKSIKEVRDNYVAVQVGVTSCSQTTEKLRCTQGSPLHLELIDISKSHVSRVWSRDIPCSANASSCRFIKIQTGSEESNGESYDGFSVDPELVGHDYELIFTLPEHVPVSFRQTDHFHVSRTATAFYVYRFGEPVSPINLPTPDETIDGK